MTDEPNLPARTNLQTGGAIAPIVPNNLDDFFRLARAMSISGMVPESLDSPEKVMVAIMAGAELGLPPFQSVQSFAVINGRPTIWGDGMLAVVRSRGFGVREWIKGSNDERTAYCEVTRPDTGELIQRSFSVAQAKTAKLWGKTTRSGAPTPWITHPDRMLAMKARAFACRDGAADILRGFKMREEMEDVEADVVDVTPAKAGVRARLEAKTETATEGFTVEHAQRIQDAKIDELLGGDNIPVANTESEKPPQPKRGRPKKTPAQNAEPTVEADAAIPASADGTEDGMDSGGENITTDDARPTETASVQSAGVGQDSSESVTDASTDSAGEAFSPPAQGDLLHDGAESDEPTDPEADAYETGIDMAESLSEVRALLMNFSKTDSHKNATPIARKRYRALAHWRLEKLYEEGVGVPPYTRDGFRFSLFLAAATPEAAKEALTEMQGEMVWKSYSAAQQDALIGSVCQLTGEHPAVYGGT